MANSALLSGPSVRQVRIGILVNGRQMPSEAISSFDVNNERYFSADTWSAELPINGLPSGYGLAFWDDQPDIEVELLASLTGGAGLTSVIGGMVDEVRINLEHQMLSIRGRDYSARLIDAVSNDKFTNQTSSQVVTTLAQRRGLTPQVTATTMPVGRFFNGQADYMGEDISEWHMASALAEQEGFDLYTRGKTLVFAPPPVDGAPLRLVYSHPTPGAIIQANSTDIKLTQKKTLAKAVTAQVRSPNHQNKTTIISTWVSTKTRAPKQSGSFAGQPTTQTRPEKQGGVNADGPFHIFRRSGLTQAQADDFAQKKLKDLSSHERTVDYSGPGILDISPLRTLILSGTGTGYDQDYPIKTIQRRFGWDVGCKMSICAKSGSPAQANRV